MTDRFNDSFYDGDKFSVHNPNYYDSSTVDLKKKFP